MGKSYQQKFDEFHKDNPNVLKLIIQYIERAKKAGFNHYSINGIFERIRWNEHIETEDRNSDFKLSNDHKTGYARLIDKDYPQHKGFFIIKESKHFNNEGFVW